MSQNITLLGATYSGVPAVTLPKSGGGTATFTDVTDTTAAAAEYYEEMYDDIDALNMTEEDGFLVVGSEPLLYLYADRQVASYSTWQVYTNETRLYRYYEIHNGEGKFPEVVYCVDAGEEIFESILVDKLLLPMGYEWKQLSHGIAFYTPR